MKNISLSCVKRNATEKLSDLRTAKKIPAVVYGHKVEAVSVTLEFSEFLRVHRAAGHSHIISLSLDGKKIDVLAHDVQYHPVTGDFQHVDFFAVSATEKLHVGIPVVLVGSSQAERDGAIIDQNLEEIEVKCLAKDLVDNFTVDISVLKEFGDVIHVSDLIGTVINTKIFEVEVDLELPVVTALEPKVEKVEDTAPVAAEVEVLTEKKEEADAE
jgi:large subunit ribosomal protein L25